MDFAENLKKYANVKTLSIAFPSSIFDNVPTPQLEAYLVGQIARAAVVFNVTEIVIFNEEQSKESDSKLEKLVKLFEYAECPQYLRKRIFSIENDLKYAGLIHPLEAQHHLRTSQIECPYREGVTMDKIAMNHKGTQKDFTRVNIGLSRSVVVPGHYPFNTRVTIQIDPADLKKISSSPDPPHAIIVSPVEPVEKLKLYWGYYVRPAISLSAAINDNVFLPDKRGFYDLIIGTSEHGDIVDEIQFSKPNTLQESAQQPSKKRKSDINHILVVFGGIKGLEHSAACDKELKRIENVASLFNYYINTCPNQGSTTIRTEEAILITLSSLRSKLHL